MYMCVAAICRCCTTMQSGHYKETLPHPGLRAAWCYWEDPTSAFLLACDDEER